MLPRTPYLSGWRGDPPGCPGVEFRILPWERFKRALEARPGGTLLVLGATAMERLSPVAVGERTHAPYALVLAVPQLGCRADLQTWRRVGGEGMEVVSPEDLQESVAACMARPARVEIPFESWAPKEVRPGSRFARVLEALTRSPKARPAEWAHSIGRERHSLERLCRKEIRMTPTVLCRSYARTYRDLEQRRGIPLAFIAASLGPGSPSSLLRGLRDD